MDRIRCAQCGSTLLFQEINDGVIEVKCKNCKKIMRAECNDGICNVEERIISVDKYPSYLINHK